VHTSDVVLVADAIEQGHWMPEECLSQNLADRFGFQISPQSSQKETKPD
jgi:hypothetical protein